MLALIALSVVALAACDNNSGETFAEGDELTLVIGYDEPQEIAIDLNGISREVTLPELFTAAKIEYEMVEGLLTKVDRLAPEPPVYIYLYTSVESDFDTSEYSETIDPEMNEGRATIRIYTENDTPIIDNAPPKTDL